MKASGKGKAVCLKEKAVCLAVFSIYMMALLYITVIRPGIYYSERQLNLALFTSLIDTYRNAALGDFLWLFLGNIGWFVPFGFLLPMLLKRKSLAVTAALGLAFSFFIETMQFVFHKGIAELDDLILNTSGVAIGYLLYWFCKSVKANGMKKREGKPS
ncbi:MAG: VanZ family protein [Clostridiales bacterium]|nr:VanZ family protein [Clostridiales bacterium]